MAVGLALGVPAALCLARYNFKLRGPLANLLLMPIVVPGVVLGTAMYVFHVEVENGLDVDVLGTFYALVAGHVVIVIPWVVRLVTASLAASTAPPRKRRKTSAPTSGSPSGASPCRRSGPASWRARCSASSPRSAISR